MKKVLKTQHGEVRLPAFFPDATRATIKSVDTQAVLATQTPGLVMNTYHLANLGLVDIIAGQGGLHNFTGWDRPIITDSGGFQAMSLVREFNTGGRFTEDGIIFQDSAGNKLELTPESCIDYQLKLGSDIIMILDDCTKPDMPMAEQLKSVERTIRWAKRARTHFDKAIKKIGHKPLLFSIVQGGGDRELRRTCAQELSKLNFDGYAFGGFPINEAGELQVETMQAVVDDTPAEAIKYAMGVGTPEQIVKSVAMGYDLFDVVIPTREARHRKLYVWSGKPEELDLNADFYSSITMKNLSLQNDSGPIDPRCDCRACKNYSRAYVHTLFRADQSVASQLASIHNLRFYSKLMELLKTTWGHIND
ncbi:tRNA guanosine(34) transglycosylase Tgt [bacterium]|nr:MAG: tRNA guanosine(34) transglycosylase Tgt [bacterium]